MDLDYIITSDGRKWKHIASNLPPGMSPNKFNTYKVRNRYKNIPMIEIPGGTYTPLDFFPEDFGPDGKRLPQFQQ